MRQSIAEFCRSRWTRARNSCARSKNLPRQSDDTGPPFDGSPAERCRTGLLAAAFAVTFIGSAPARMAWGHRPPSHGPATKRIVASETKEKPGTILISTAARTLDLVVAPGKVARYSIGVAKDGFVWKGTVKVGRQGRVARLAPPAEMLAARPEPAGSSPGRPVQSTGRARDLPLQGRARHALPHSRHQRRSFDRRLRSSGCFRMTNADVLELYSQVTIGAKVIVE